MPFITAITFFDLVYVAIFFSNFLIRELFVETKVLLIQLSKLFFSSFVKNGSCKGDTFLPQIFLRIFIKSFEIFFLYFGYYLSFF